MNKNNKGIIALASALSLVGVGAIAVSGISMSKNIANQKTQTEISNKNKKETQDQIKSLNDLIKKIKTKSAEISSKNKEETQEQIKSLNDLLKEIKTNSAKREENRKLKNKELMSKIKDLKNTLNKKPPVSVTDSVNDIKKIEEFLSEFSDEKINKFGFLGAKESNDLKELKGNIKADFLARKENLGQLWKFIKKFKESIVNDKKLQNNAVNKLAKISDRGFQPTKGIIASLPIKNIANKQDIDTYNKEVREFNKEQKKLLNIAIANLNKKEDKGYDSFYKIPVMPTLENSLNKNSKNKIDEYNKQIKAFNDDQGVKLKKGVDNLHTKKDKGFASTIAIPKKPTTDDGNKKSIDTYNTQVDEFNTNQVAKLKEGIDGLHAKKDKGFASTIAIPKKPTTDDGNKKSIDTYNTQVDEFNTNQVAKLKEGIDGLHAKKDKGFASTIAIPKKPTTDDGNKKSIDTYNTQVDEFNTNQVAKLKKAINELHAKKDKGFASTIAIPKKPTTDDGNKKSIDTYNTQVDEFNTNQVAKLKEGIDGLHAKKDKGFASTIAIPKMPTTDDGNKKSIDAYNTQVEAFNVEQVGKLAKYKLLSKNIISKSKYSFKIHTSKKVGVAINWPSKKLVDCNNKNEVDQVVKEQLKYNKFESYKFKEIQRTIKNKLPEIKSPFNKGHYVKRRVNKLNKKILETLNKQIISINSDKAYKEYEKKWKETWKEELKKPINRSVKKWMKDII